MPKKRAECSSVCAVAGILVSAGCLMWLAYAPPAGIPIEETDADRLCPRPSWVGDGTCDHLTNIPACGFDGGDCCSDTCAEDGTFACGLSGWQCRDPRSADEGTSTILSDCNADTLQVGDGACDRALNNEACQYDGNDCCATTCRSSTYKCGSAGYDECLGPDLVDSEAGAGSERAAQAELAASLAQADRRGAAALASAVISV